ncbi:hypothetical protein [Aliihoeflea sp. PC F10.4]
MRTLLLTASAVALSCSIALAQTPPPPPDAPEPPPPGEEMDAGGMNPDAAANPEENARGAGGPRHEMREGGPRHHMRPGGPRGGPGWRAMRSGPEFKVEIDEDGAVKVEAKCSPREETRACADITMELLDRALGN